MTKNPFVNAVLAALYIVLVACVMFYGTKHMPGPDNSVIIPIGVLSLLTLSAAVMFSLFVLKPMQMYVDGQKKEAVVLFGKTLGIFAVITVLVLAAMFSSVI